MTLKKLPVGIQTFEKIRSEGYVYVDKTKYLIDLIDSGVVYFLSRPRRFGKSMTVTAFEALFSGRRELFEGLYAEEFFDRPKYKPHPIVRLDMSELTTNMGSDVLRSSLLDRVKENAARLGVNIETAQPGDALSNLLGRAADRHGANVVVLVDEYDKPILDNLHDMERAEGAREILRDFYVRIKAADRHVRFVFITGISKFSKMGVFSAMNNLEDISMNDKYAAMMGYTEEELLAYFNGHIEEAAARLGKPKDALIAAMRAHYDGFSFDGNTMLYNPFSTLNFFKNPDFRNYWFESGTPSFIARYMKDRMLTVEQFRGFEVSRNFASYPGEIENATAASFLYQSGYLSLRPGLIEDYSLDYPNNEVLSAMSALLTSNILGSDAAGASVTGLKTALSGNDAAVVVKEFNRLLAKIPYDDYNASVREHFEMRNPYVNFGEWLYRSTLLSYLYGAGLRVEAELHGHKGRSDIVAEFRGHVW
ncbi:MAG: AAA family ATPase, partial [Synergistaceae bacterium]|nr:AAA family ATPase [Synergistaceae bacterium]